MPRAARGRRAARSRLHRRVHAARRQRRVRDLARLVDARWRSSNAVAPGASSASTADVVERMQGGGGRCRLRPTSSASPIGPDDVLRMIRERLAEILEIDEDRDHPRLRLRRRPRRRLARADRAGRGARGGARRAHRRLQHRRRRPRRPAHGARRGRLRHRTGSEPTRGADGRVTSARRRATPRDSTRGSQLALGWTFVDHVAPRPRADPPLVLRGARRSRSRTSASSSSATPCSGFVVTDFVLRRSTRSCPKASWRSCAPRS